MEDVIALVNQSYSIADEKIEYTLVFLAFERLFRAYDKQISLSPTFGSDWGEYVKTCLMPEIVKRVEENRGRVSGSQRKRLERKVTEANSPSQFRVLSEFCRKFDLEPIRESHIKLRDLIFHEGSHLRNYDDEHVKNHTLVLRHIVHLILLKMIDYNGYCMTDLAKDKPINVNEKLAFGYSQPKRKPKER